jgi:hypothetical protein
MSENQGKFVWYDLMTNDVKAAETFYRSVIGWDAKDAGVPDRPYTLLSMGSTMVGGLMPIPEDARARGARPSWNGYIGVDDVDAYAKRVTDAKGSVIRPPEDIPNVGRFAVVADPHGAVFLLFHALSGAPTPPVAMNTPGTVGWHELHAGDLESDFAFYSGLFGWTKVDTVDMGPMGTYQIFATGGAPVGGMMNKMPEMPMPHWLYYFNVDDIDAAAERVRKAGGKVVNGPQEVPGGSWIVHAFDPQGVMCALVGPKR